MAIRKRLLCGLTVAVFALGLGGTVASAARPDDNFAPVCTDPSNTNVPGVHSDIGDPGHSGGPGNGTGKDCSSGGEPH